MSKYFKYKVADMEIYVDSLQKSCGKQGAWQKCNATEQSNDILKTPY